MTEQNMNQLPSVSDFVAHIVVQKVNGQQFVKLQDFQAVVQLGQAFEDQLAAAINYFGDEQDKQDLMIRGQAMDTAARVASRIAGTNPDDAVKMLAAIFNLAYELLSIDPAAEYEEEPEDTPVDPGEALAALSKGDS